MLKKGLAYLLVFFEPGPAYSREGLVYFGEGLVYFSGRSGLLLRVCRLRLKWGLVHPFVFCLWPGRANSRERLVWFTFGWVWFTFRQGLVYFGEVLAYV